MGNTPYRLPENTTFYIVPGGTADVLLTLAPDVDPETLFMYCNYDGSQPAVLSCQTEEGYAFQSAIDSIETTGYGDSSMCLYNALDSETPLMQVILFANEENVNEVVATSLADENGNATVSWQYADGTKPSTTARPTTSATTSSEVTYTVKYVDSLWQVSPARSAMIQPAPPISLTKTACVNSPCPLTPTRSTP